MYFQNGCSEVSESSSTSSELGNSISNLNSNLLSNSTASSNKAPGSQLTHKPVPFHRRSTIGLELNNKLLAIEKDPTLGRFIKIFYCELKCYFAVVLYFTDSLEREQRKQTLCFAYSSLGSSFFSTGNDTVESVVGEYNMIFSSVCEFCVCCFYLFYLNKYVLKSSLWFL